MALPWDQTDQVNIRSFLSSETGKRLITILVRKTPKERDEDPMTQAMNAREGIGWGSCLKAIEDQAKEHTPYAEGDDFVDVTAGLTR